MAEAEQENMEGRGGPGEVVGRRSNVWSYFVVSKDDNGKDIATCKRCQKSLGAETKQGTSHLKRHLGSCTRQDGPPAKQPRPPPAAPGHHIAESSELPAEGSWSGQEECGAELARMIAFHGYPSSVVDDECFRTFVRGLNPRFRLPSRAAVEGSCHSLAEDAMNQLKETMSCCSGQMSLATGTTEAGQGRVLYMACQFIDNEWALQKRIMQVFRVVHSLPIGRNMLLGAEEVCLDLTDTIQEQVSVPGTGSRLEEAVRLWGLQGRLFSVAWGEEIEKNLKRKDFLDTLCPFIRVGEGSIEIPVVLCVTYTSEVLNSVGDMFVQGLSGKYEESCFRTVKGVSLSHEKRTQNFSDLGLNHVGRYNKRWYTYYCALEVLHKEYSDNNEALHEEPKLNTAQIMALLARCTTPMEMEANVKHLTKPPKLKEDAFTDLLRKILGTVYQAFKAISSPTSPTANLCFKELMKLRAVVQSEAKDARTVVAKAVAYAKLGCFSNDKDADVLLREVQGVLDSHLKEAYLYLSIPAVLDPRFKLEYVAIALHQVFESEAPTYISRVKERIEDMFDEHKRKLRSIINGEGTSRMAAGIVAEAMDIDGYSQEGTTELERYLTDGLVPPREEGEGFDVLVWWKANSSRYPTVASMARDALAMPASDMLSPEHTARIRSMMSNCCVTYPETLSHD